MGGCTQDAHAVDGQDWNFAAHGHYKHGKASAQQREDERRDAAAEGAAKNTADGEDDIGALSTQEVQGDETYDIGKALLLSTGQTQTSR